MLATLLIRLIRAYQWFISPLLGNVCRFHPSCSNYCMKCIEYHGVIRGTWLTAKRLARCHPFHPGGYDPPPPPKALASGGASSPASDGEAEHDKLDTPVDSARRVEVTQSASNLPANADC